MSQLEFKGGQCRAEQVGASHPIAAILAQSICAEMNAGTRPLAASAAQDVATPSTHAGRISEGPAGNRGRS